MVRWTDAVLRDALGFKRIGRVPGCGNLKSYPDRLVDAIIYGRDLTLSEEESDELVSEDRFEKIKFYLKHGKYPNGADRAEKSRLRSAATHYKLLENDVLMLKDKEVISDPERQYEIARQTHAFGQHAGINKTTATITERYHWRGIKDTVSDVIRVCAECEDKSNAGLMKPSTPSQTSNPHPLPPTSILSVSAVKNSEAVRPENREPVRNQHHHHHHQERMTSTFPSVSQDETPIDPQIMNQHPIQPSHVNHSELHDHTSHYPYFSPQTDIDLGPEDHAILHLLNASTSTHIEGATGEITDQDLDMMLTRQLEEEADAGGTRMDVDSHASLFMKR